MRHLFNKATIISLFCSCLSLLSIYSPAHSQAVLPNGVADIPWNQRTWEQKTVESTYMDEFSNKNKMVFPKDPFVWAYSQAFADRFGMPNEWVDPNLKGALAIAWRTTSIGQMSCGYGGDPNACWPPFTCQMDIYVDSDAPIPWRFNDVTRDFLWDGLSSLDFVPKRMPAPRRFRYAYTAGALGSVGLPFYTEGLRTKSKNYTSSDGSFNIVYFDRAYAPGVTLLGFKSACPSTSVKDAAVLRFFTDEEQKRTRGVIVNYAYEIEISQAFIEKIAKLYENEKAERMKSNSAYQNAMKRHLPDTQK